MGLLNYYNDTNKVITEGKRVFYSSMIEHGQWSWNPEPNIIQTYGHNFRITRTCTYQYSYVGMDYTTAINCMWDLRENLTRTTTISVWDNFNGEFVEQNGGDMLMSDVKMIWTGGDMWSVQVNVNEVDVRMRLVDSSTPSSLFADENRRQYDF